MNNGSNEKLKKARLEYEKNIASENLKLEVRKIMKEKANENSKKTFSIWKNACSYAVAGVIGLLVVFTFTLNVSESFASTLANVPALSGVVNVLTFNRYQIDTDNYHAEISAPQLEGLIDEELQEKLNAEFKEFADILAVQFENEIKEMQNDGASGHTGIDSNYIIRTDNEDILAIDIYIVNTVGSSSTVHKFYTIDKKEGKLITLKSLFEDDADYITPISSYIREEMKRQNAEEEKAFWILGEEEYATNVFEEIKEDQNFFINEDGNIVIVFDKYEVAPGYMGSPEFVIPAEVVSGLIK